MKIDNSAIETRFLNYKGRRYVKDSIYSSEQEAEIRAQELRAEGYLAIVAYATCGTFYNPKGSCYVVNKVWATKR